MKTYDIFYRQADKSSEAVKQGFSWPAFFFGWIWAYIKGMGGVGTLLLLWALIANAISLGEPEGGPAVVFVFGLIITITMGARGNLLWRRKLLKKGYQEIESIMASTPDDAIIEFQKKVREKGEPEMQAVMPASTCQELPEEKNAAVHDWILLAVIVYMSISRAFWAIAPRVMDHFYSSTLLDVMSPVLTFVWAVVPLSLAFIVQNKSRKYILFGIGGLYFAYGVFELVQGLLSL